MCWVELLMSCKIVLLDNFPIISLISLHVKVMVAFWVWNESPFLYTVDGISFLRCLRGFPRGATLFSLASPSLLPLYVCGCFFCVHVWTPHSKPSAHRSEGVTSRTGATDSCELPCGCWMSNLGPLKEQLLTSEPSLSRFSSWKDLSALDCPKSPETCSPLVFRV